MIHIVKNGQITNSGPDQEWLDSHIQMGTFGRAGYTVEHLITPEHTIQRELSPAVMAEDGSIITEAVVEDVVVPAVIELEVIPAEYQVVIEDASVQIQREVNAASRAYLAETDWMIIREAEGGTPCSPEIKQLRADARAAIVN